MDGLDDDFETTTNAGFFIEETGEASPIGPSFVFFANLYGVEVVRDHLEQKS